MEVEEIRRIPAVRNDEEELINPETQETFKALAAIDWKDNPDQIAQQFNRLLKEFGVDMEFVEIDTGSDTFVYTMMKSE